MVLCLKLSWRLIYLNMPKWRSFWSFWLFLVWTLFQKLSSISQCSLPHLECSTSSNSLWCETSKLGDDNRMVKGQPTCAPRSQLETQGLQLLDLHGSDQGKWIREGWTMYKFGHKAWKFLSQQFVFSDQWSWCRPKKLKLMQDLAILGCSIVTKPRL